jgi:hypothetical protein
MRYRKTLLVLLATLLLHLHELDLNRCRIGLVFHHLGFVKQAAELAFLVDVPFELIHCDP